MGTSMVAMAYGLRAQLGRIAAYAAGVLLAIGPSYLYFSRFAREDIYIAAITMAMLVVTFRFFDVPRRWHPAAFGALLALSFATKESTFITIFVAGSFFLVAIAVQARAPRGCARRRSCARCCGVGWEAVRVGRRRVPGRLHAHVHHVPDAPERHLRALDRPRLLARPARRRPRRRGARASTRWCCSRTSGRCCCSAPSGAVAAFRRPTLLRLFLVWAFVLSLAVYSWAGEKFAWLVLHPLLPLILLAGVGLQAIWAARPQLARQGRARGHGARAGLHGLRLRARQRRPPRRPARVPRLHAVLDRRRRPGARDRRAGRSAATAS